MTTTRDHLAALATNAGQYLQRSQPYYIVAPSFSDRSAGIRLLHSLCSLLNQLGFDAYLEGPKIDGNYWTPQLTKAVVSSHYKAGKKPIVIYPEVVHGHPMQLGIPVRYVLYYPGAHGGPAHYQEELVYCYRKAFYPDAEKLQLPLLDKSLFFPPPEGSQRDLTLVYYNRYTGPVKRFSLDQREISSKNPVPYKETGDLYRRAKILYAYEEGAAVTEARMCGCPVVLVPNPLRLPEKKEDYFQCGHSGLAWGLDPDDIERAVATAHLAPSDYDHTFKNWREELYAFIETTQRHADAASFDSAWTDDIIDGLPDVQRSDIEWAQRADRAKRKRISQQYEQWRRRTTLRELDAQEYAEHWTSPAAQALTILIDNRDCSDSRLADTIDSIAANLGHPSHILILRGNLANDLQHADAGITWINSDLDLQQSLGSIVSTDWLAIVRAGDQLDPRTLVEWSIYASQNPGSSLFYSDEDVTLEQDTGYPYFKPDLNIELLKCSNYIGSTVLVKTKAWLKAKCPTQSHEIYDWALHLAHDSPTQITHIDDVLFHTGATASQEIENNEFAVIQSYLEFEGRGAKALPTDYWSSWLIEYPVSRPTDTTLVIPTGLQVGYLGSLLDGIRQYRSEHLSEVILVCHEDHYEEVENARQGALPLPVRIITYRDASYNHARVLNQAVAAANTPFITVADDDIEPLHDRWLDILLGLCSTDGVGCVAPRLVSAKDTGAKVTGGPLVLGINGTYAPYNGENGHLLETGPYSRLQLTQDVSAVAGHCFVFKRADWASIGGFDEDQFPLRHAVVDFCLRLGQKGLRHVWTPLTGVLHHGGKTIEAISADPHVKLALADTELAEQKCLVEKWSEQLANDRSYNRHLSLFRPHDIESDIVIDWKPGRVTRTKVLALPVHSGAGQYRVIEPLDALQNAGLIRSSVIMPLANRTQRVLQPLELLRAKPDVLYLQYAISDHQLTRNIEYKKIMPTVRIVQSVDDLLGNVPEKHPNRSYQLREGHRRMMQAIASSDRLIVTTQPLAEHYLRYTKRVDIVPNSLTETWFKLNPWRNPSGERPRIGWVGAQQHKGDLELIISIVQHFAERVDWIFMGMCIDEIKPFVKEVHPFVSIDEYPEKMSKLALDIAIAPLEDNAFNRCKSNLRLLEYGAMGWPVVCSDVYPFRTDNPPVLHCKTTEEWIAAIGTLLDDTTLRQSMARRLHDWVVKRYQLEHWLPKWANALKH